MGHRWVQRHHPAIEKMPWHTELQRALPPPASTSHVTADFLLSLCYEQHSHLLNPLLFPMPEQNLSHSWLQLTVLSSWERGMQVQLCRLQREEHNSLQLFFATGKTGATRAAACGQLRAHSPACFFWGGEKHQIGVTISLDVALMLEKSKGLNQHFKVSLPQHQRSTGLQDGDMGSWCTQVPINPCPCVPQPTCAHQTLLMLEHPSSTPSLGSPC